MDIFSRLFWFGGALIAAVVFISALFALSNAEDGVLTVENLQHLEPQFTSLFNVMVFFVYPWMALGLFLLLRFLKRAFSK